MSRARFALVALVLLAGALCVARWASTSSTGSLALDAVLAAWFATPFVPVAAAVADGNSGRVATGAAFAAAVAGTLLVPWWVGTLIENDPSSTASVVHVYDPIPVVLAVGLILGLDFIVRRRRDRPP